MVWHSKCWDDYYNNEQFMKAAAHIDLPEPIRLQEKDSNRDPATFLAAHAPSAVVVAEAYQLTCERMRVHYAAPDVGEVGSWGFSIPEEAAVALPIDRTVFTEGLFWGMFRYRAVFEIGMDLNMTPARLYSAIRPAVVAAMEATLTGAERNAFMESEKDKMDLVKDYCEVSVFGHATTKKDDSGLSWQSVVVELAIPRAKLQTTLALFTKCFLDPDGEVQRESDKMVWAEVFSTAETPETTEITLPDGASVVPGINTRRQRQNRRAWTLKREERRAFLQKVMNGVQVRLTEKVVVKKSDSRVSRNSECDMFCNSWQDKVLDVENKAETTRWQYLVNAQVISTFRGVKDLPIYVASMDMKTLLCFHNESTATKDWLYDYLPCVWAGEPEMLQQELVVRNFKPVLDKEIRLIYSWP